MQQIYLLQSGTLQILIKTEQERAAFVNLKKKIYCKPMRSQKCFNAPAKLAAKLLSPVKQLSNIDKKTFTVVMHTVKELDFPI